MKLSTEAIRFRLILKYTEILGKTLKLVGQYKNNRGQHVKEFTSNIGTIYVILDAAEKNINEVFFENSTSEEEVKTNMKDYYFAVSTLPTFDRFSNSLYFELAIVSKEYWTRENDLDDQPLEIEENLLQYKIESPNETSEFQALGYKDKESVINLLLGLGMEYNNDIANFLNSLGSDMYLKP